MKKNIFVLLLLPFAVSVFGVVGVTATVAMLEKTVNYIDWDYEDYEGFEISSSMTELKARGINASDFTIIGNDDLTWSVANSDDSGMLHAKIVYQDKKYYLEPLSVGEVTVTCSNQAGNISRHFQGVIYENSTILIKTKISSSQNSKSGIYHVGRYDLENNTKKDANLKLEFVSLPKESTNEVSLVSQSDNIACNLATSSVDIHGTGSATFTLQNARGAERSFSFDVVDGVNVYEYEDLLYCTNESASGEVMVLQKSFESLNSYNEFSKKNNNVELFGKQNEEGKFDFSQDVYSFTTTYNHDYIDGWNKFAEENDKYEPVSDQLKAGLHIQKDVYGNGFTINFHNLAYPYGSVTLETDEKEYQIPKLRDDNLFRGPLPFYTLGNPNANYLISSLGQDNSGLYVDGDDITIDDISLMNCADPDALSFLDYVGNVVDVHGNNIAITNSSLANGRNVLRTFSSSLKVENTSFRNARNFLLVTGANESVKVDLDRRMDFMTKEGTYVNTTMSDFLSPNQEGDSLFDSYLDEISSSMRDNYKQAIQYFEENMVDLSEVRDNYKGETEISDCQFFVSGITAIGMESLFCGPYLINGNCPSFINYAFNRYLGEEQNSLVPYIASDMGNVSYPVKLKLDEKTLFKQSKTQSEMNIKGLISENITSWVLSTALFGQSIDIDDLFPLKTLLYQDAKESGYLSDSGALNAPVMFYGGGVNLSTVDYSSRTDFSSVRNISFLDQYVNLSESYINMGRKIVTTFTGFQPFKFIYQNNEKSSA